MYFSFLLFDFLFSLDGLFPILDLLDLLDSLDKLRTEVSGDMGSVSTVPVLASSKECLFGILTDMSSRKRLTAALIISFCLDSESEEDCIVAGYRFEVNVILL